MINDYDQFADAMDLKGGDVNRCIDDLAELKEVSPAVFELYDREYQKQKQARRQKQARQTKQPERKGGKMFMTFKEYETALDTAGSTSLMGGDDNLRKISAFAKEYPAQYADYRERLRNKQQEQHNARRF